MRNQRTTDYQTPTTNGVMEQRPTAHQSAPVHRPINSGCRVFEPEHTIGSAKVSQKQISFESHTV